MSKTTIIILVVVAVAGIAAFVFMSRKKPSGSVVSVAPPVSVPKQANLVSQIVASAPSLINSLSSAYSAYEEYKD